MLANTQICPPTFFADLVEEENTQVSSVSPQPNMVDNISQVPLALAIDTENVHMVHDQVPLIYDDIMPTVSDEVQVKQFLISLTNNINLMNL